MSDPLREYLGKLDEEILNSDERTFVFPSEYALEMIEGAVVTLEGHKDLDICINDIEITARFKVNDVGYKVKLRRNSWGSDLQLDWPTLKVEGESNGP